LVAPLVPGVHTVNGRDIFVIGAAEVSGHHDGREFHLLVYFPGEVPEEFRAFCTRQMRARADRYAGAVERLDLQGLEGPDEAAKAGSLTRLHLAHAMIEAGHATHLRDAFDTFRAKEAVPQIAMSFIDAIKMAVTHGGITSWAHPPMQHVRSYLATFVEAGLHGLEAHRPRVSGKDRKTLKKMAKRYNLVLTGGSDWHGWNGHQLGLFHVNRAELEPFLELLSVA
jgi:predicted metal-dependent phosphoesterase TrpH